MGKNYPLKLSVPLTCVESPHGCLDPRGVVDGSSGNGASGRIGLEEGAADIADSHG